MEKFTDEVLAKWLKNYNSAILKLSQRIDELDIGSSGQANHELNKIAQELRRCISKVDRIDWSSDEITAALAALELVEKRSEDAADLANASADAAADAKILAEIASNSADKALSGESEWGQSITKSIGKISEENETLSGKVVELSEAADGLSSKVASFEGSMVELTKEGGTLDSLSGSISTVSQKADKNELRVSNVEDGVATNASSIKQLADNITLQLVDTDGNVLTQIKMEDYKIKLTGDVLIDTLLVSKLFAQDITATGNFQINNGVWGIVMNNNVLRIGVGLDEGVANSALISISPGYISVSSMGKSGTIDLGANRVMVNSTELLNPSIDSWIPVVAGAASYSVQSGRIMALGSLIIVQFYVSGEMAGSTTEKFKISGLPVNPSTHSGGGGTLSGYTAASDTVFTGWVITPSGNICPQGQQTGVAEGDGNKWATLDIFQKSAGAFNASGTIAFTI